MAKRGKERAVSKVKAMSKPISSKKPEFLIEDKSNEIQPQLSDTLRQLENIAQKKKIEEKIEDVGRKEAAIEKKESKIIAEEKKLEKETQKVESLEKEIKREVQARPLTRFNMKDLNKGIIGAFIGVVAHFAFIYGKEIAKEISITRATILMLASYLLIIILMYETGYREIKEKRLLWILPRRATAIYLTSLVMIVVIFFMFNLIDLKDPVGMYKQIAVTSVLASMGAGSADLIGRD